MSKLPFRDKAPVRTYTGPDLTNYRDYKPYLKTDFDSKCGYTYCLDFWFGGQRNFQIDHVKPQSIHSNLKNKYSNLVYSCSYVNRAKSNDDNEYLDPCNVDYNLHFYRDQSGNIFPIDNSEKGKYMYKKLKLYLKRYSIIWTLEQLEARMDKLKDLIQRTGDSEAQKLFQEITFKYMDYKKYLRAEQ